MHQTREQAADQFARENKWKLTAGMESVPSFRAGWDACLAAIPSGVALAAENERLRAACEEAAEGLRWIRRFSNDEMNAKSEATKQITQLEAALAATSKPAEGTP